MDPVPTPTWKQKYGDLILSVATKLAIAAVAALAAWLGIQPKTVTVEKVVEKKTVLPAELNPNGVEWDAAASDRDARAAVFGSFGDTPAGQMADVLPKAVYGWKAIEFLTGKPAPAADQNPTGACVGFGGARAVERTLASEIVRRKGDASEYTPFSEECVYAGAKVNAAKKLGMSISRQDGATGIGQKVWLTEVGGLVPKGKYGSVDLTEYSASRAKSWNVSGVPAELVEVAKKHRVADAVKVTSWEQAKKSMAADYYVSICASWSFTEQRDANGVAQPTSEGWNHCMALDGYHIEPDGTEYGHIENSWSKIPGYGPYHRGPTGWGNPSTAGFWAKAEYIDRALRQGQSYAYSGVIGFPARKPLDWAMVRPRRDEAFALSSRLILKGGLPCSVEFSLSP